MAGNSLILCAKLVALRLAWSRRKMNLPISWDANEAKNKVNSLIETDSEGEARSLFRLCSQEQWNYKRAKHELSTSAWLKEIKPILYRPFDIRWTVYNQNVAVHRRERVMRHMLAGTNIGICTNKEVNGNFHHILCSREIINDCTVSLQTKERTYLFPLLSLPIRRRNAIGWRASPFESES